MLILIVINIIIANRRSLKGVFPTLGRLHFIDRFPAIRPEVGFGIFNDKEIAKTKFNLFAAVYMVVFSIFSLHYFGQTPIHYRFDLSAFKPKPGFDVLYKLVDEIPEKASVSVPSDIGVLFCERMKAYLFPNIGDADYIVFDRYHRDGDDYWDLNQVIAVLKTGKYGIFKETGRFVVLKKDHPTTGVDKLVEELVPRARY